MKHNIISRRSGTISKEKKYIRNNQRVFLKRKYFKNDSPIRIPMTSDEKELKLVDFADIPVIEDFEIVLRDNGEKYGFSLFYYSPTYNILTRFLCWDNVIQDLKKMNLKDIPSGDFKNPFTDIDQGWQILIYEKMDFIFIFEGVDEGSDIYTSYYKVPKSMYLNKWKKIIEYAKEEL